MYCKLVDALDFVAGSRPNLNVVPGRILDTFYNIITHLS